MIDTPAWRDQRSDLQHKKPGECSLSWLCQRRRLGEGVRRGKLWRKRRGPTVGGHGTFERYWFWERSRLCDTRNSCTEEKCQNCATWALPTSTTATKLGHADLHGSLGVSVATIRVKIWESNRSYASPKPSTARAPGA
jgi:hypothetical protein